MLIRWRVVAIALALVAGVMVQAQSVELASLDPALGTEKNPIPKGWEDNSSWADLDVTYQKQEFEGVAHLRVQCTRFKSGRVQLIYRLPNLKPGKLYQLTFEARAPSPLSMEVKIRQPDSPYKAYWRELFNLGTTFEQFDTLVAVEEPAKSSMLMFVFEQVGMVDIRKVTLREIEAVAESEVGPPTNLIRTSRFPLGLPGTSMIWRSIPDSKITLEGDPTTIGPSGSPALHLVGPPEGTEKSYDATDSLRFDGELFPIKRRMSPHTAQFMAKGKGSGRFAVMANGKVLKEVPFKVDSEEWKPVTLHFKPRPASNLHLCRWQVNGEVWIDSLQVHAGKESLDYANLERPEVSLAVPASDASAAKIQFGEEPAEIDWAVTGDLKKPAFLAATLFHVDGTSKKLKRVPLETGKYLQQGKFTTSVWPERPLGTFRLEAQVVDENGAALGPWGELVWHRVMRPRYWGKFAPDSAFGAHLNAAERQITMAKAIGVNWVRLHDTAGNITNWVWMEKEPGEWTFADEDLQRFRDGKMEVLGMLATTPKWARLKHLRNKKGDAYFDRFFLPESPEKDFRNYVRTVVERYKDSIRAYEVWNEPWQIRWFAVDYRDGQYLHPENPQAEYVKLKKVAYDEVKKIDPEITVVGLNTSYASNTSPDYHVGGKEWTNGVLEAGGMDYADVGSTHIYINNPGGYPTSPVDVGLARGVGPNEAFERLEKPVWMSEGSSTYTKLAMGFYNRSLPNPVLDPNERLAEGVLRYHVSLLSRGVEKIFLYAMHVGGIRNSSSFSSLVNRNNSLHPSAIAHATLAWHVDGLDYHSVTEIAPQVWLYTWEGDDRSAAVILPQTKDNVFVVESKDGLEHRNIWGNPVGDKTTVPTSGTFVNAPGLKAQALIEALQPPALKE